MERLVEWNCKEKNSALPICINDFGDVVSTEDICAQLATLYDIIGDYDLDRLRELVQADKAGRCFVSEIELGGEVFYIPKFNGVPYCGVKKGHVQALSFTRAGKRVKIREHHAHNQDFMLGKTVFRTREEAEAALEKTKEAKP